jgi:hypothetical protein
MALPPFPSPEPPRIGDRREQQRLRLFFYLIPIVGVIPALWSLYGPRSPLAQRNPSSLARRERQISRMAVILGLGWALSTGLVSLGSTWAEVPELGRLVLGSGLTSAYFLVNFWLMVQLWRNQSLWLPGVTDWGDRLP